MKAKIITVIIAIKRIQFLTIWRLIFREARNLDIEITKCHLLNSMTIPLDITNFGF